MSVKIKLKRMGKIRAPYYRIVVADARAKRDGRAIEEIGIYHPKENPSRIEVDSVRVQYWLGVGAQPTDPVRALLKVTGDWQTFRGEAAPEPMKVAKERATRTEVYEKLLAEAKSDDADAAPAKRSSRKKSEPEAAATDTAESPDLAATADAAESAASEATAEVSAAAESAAPAEAGETGEAADTGETGAADASESTDATA